MSKTDEIKFTRREPWACPSYEDYFIKDRCSGKDVHGNETYQYALFRKRPFVVVAKFRTRKQAYEYVHQKTGMTALDVQLRSPNLIANDSEHIGVYSGDEMYRIDKRTRTVSVRPVEDERITCWYDRYTECLNDAKALLAEMVS